MNLIFKNFVFCALLAQIVHFIPIPAVIFPAVLLIAIVVFWMYVQGGGQDKFEAILVLLCLFHFPKFLQGAGGIFTLSASFFVILVLFFIKKSRNYTNRTFVLLVLFFCITNFISYVFSDLNISSILIGIPIIIAITGFLIITGSLVVTKKKIIKFYLVLAYMNIFNLFIAFNSNIKIIDINSPLIMSSYEIDDTYQIIANTGSFTSVELYGEYGMLNAFIFLPLVVSKIFKSRFTRFQRNLIIGGYLSSVINCYLSFSKASILILIVGHILILLYCRIQKRNSFRIRGILIRNGVLSLVLLPFLGVYLGLEIWFERLNENPEFLLNFLDNPFTAKGTTREVVYELGFDRISEKTWILGNGISNPKGNYYSLFNSYEYLKYVDFHSFYLSAIPIFGKLGLSIFVLIVVRTIFKLNRVLKKFKVSKSGKGDLFLVFNIGLMFYLFFFLIHEYKINALRDSYFFIFLFMLGLANASLKNYKKPNF